MSTIQVRHKIEKDLASIVSASKDVNEYLKECKKYLHSHTHRQHSSKRKQNQLTRVVLDYCEIVYNVKTNIDQYLKMALKIETSENIDMPQKSQHIATIADRVNDETIKAFRATVDASFVGIDDEEI